LAGLGSAWENLAALGADADALVALLDRWRAEAVKAGQRIERTMVAFEAGAAALRLRQAAKGDSEQGFAPSANAAPRPGHLGRPRSVTDRAGPAS